MICTPICPLLRGERMVSAFLEIRAPHAIRTATLPYRSAHPIGASLDILVGVWPLVRWLGKESRSATFAVS